MDRDTKRWARSHRRLSIATIRRRFLISRAEAEAMLAELIKGGVLHSEPEGESYLVRYPRPVKESPWWNPQAFPRTYIYRG